MVKHKGFSLIELMIATTILTVVMFSGYLAYGLYTTKWQKRVDEFWYKGSSALGIERVTRSLNAMENYIVNWQGNSKKPVMLFEGSDSELIYVSNSPLLSSDAAIIKLSLVKNKRGLNDLIYSEVPLSNQLITTWPQQLTWPKPILVMRDLKEFRFNFYGWLSLQQEFEANEDVLQRDLSVPLPTPSWYETHISEQRQLTPLVLQIQFQLDTNEELSSYLISMPTDNYLKLTAYMRLDF